MAVTSRAIPKTWKERDTSPERTKIWTEPKWKTTNERKVAVVYYLSRNGQLEHPHFMEVPLSSPDGLYLRDVINRFNILRGKGVASMYSWSAKRSYKSGFVWHDLGENDFIYPAHGGEYLLKGSEILEPSRSSKFQDTASMKPEKPAARKNGIVGECEFSANTQRRNQSWSSIDLPEYKVYSSESTSESTQNPAADASTQTDDRRRRRAVKEEGVVQEEENSQKEVSQSTELRRDEISPPPSDSSPETLESLMKADGRLTLCSRGGNENGGNPMGESCPSGRMRASSVLMQVLSCGTMSLGDCGALTMKDQGLSLIGHRKAKLARGAGDHGGKEEGTVMANNGFSRVRLEDKEYFSGSLIDTKKEEVPTLMKSSSYNADRISQLQLREKEIDGVKAKCIPRKPKTLPAAAKQERRQH